MIRVGTAGWSYPDWEGIVYRRGASATKEALEVLAGLFTTLEINVTYYRPPAAGMAASWVRRVEPHPEFLFTAKLWQGFTHQRDQRHDAEEKAFKDGIAPLMEGSRLGAVLAQFPHSFRNSPDNRRYLDQILDRFASLPLVVELRHATWHTDALFSALAAREVGFCNVDQPQVGAAAPPTAVMTCRLGYVRMHGRNSANWFKKDAGRDARYDYLYSHEEIREWVERVRLMQGKRKGDADIFIIANNHYRGQAPANALEIASMIEGRKVEVPDTLLAAYPRLEAVATTTERPGMLPL